MNNISGTIKCTNGRSSSGTLNLQSSKSSGSSGHFYINAGGQKSGSIYGGHIASKTFTLTGTENHDGICNPSGSASIKYTITGHCNGNTVTFRSSNGETGNFFRQDNL